MVEKTKNLESAIDSKDFDSFAEICMRDSNEFHSICSDSFPPIFYLNETSQMIINFVHWINKYFENIDNTNKNENENEKENKKKNKYFVCYTFDAGPNAVLIAKNENTMNIVVGCLKILFEAKWQRQHNESESESKEKDDNDEFLYDPLQFFKNKSVEIQDNTLVQELKSGFLAECEQKCQLDKLILTRVGSGAKIVSK